MVRVLYFAWVRERVGAGEELIDVPADVATVGDLAAWLEQRSAGHAEALADRTRIRAAVDQSFAGWDMLVSGAREVAFFPPVTGG